MERLEAYKGVWALSTVDKGGMLKATHMCYPIVYGREPIWIVATIDGKFVRYAGSRGGIERLYPKLVWRRWMVRWKMLDAVNHPTKVRKDEAAETYGKKVPKPEDLNQ